MSPNFSSLLNHFLETDSRTDSPIKLQWLAQSHDATLKGLFDAKQLKFARLGFRSQIYVFDGGDSLKYCRLHTECVVLTAEVEVHMSYIPGDRVGHGAVSEVHLHGVRARHAVQVFSDSAYVLQLYWTVLAGNWCQTFYNYWTNEKQGGFLYRRM